MFHVDGWTDRPDKAKGHSLQLLWQYLRMNTNLWIKWQPITQITANSHNVLCIKYTSKKNNIQHNTGTIHININLNSRTGMRKVHENNHTLVPYHEQFFYTHKPDISSLSTNILLMVKENEVQQTLMSVFQLSLQFAVTLNAKNNKYLSMCSSW